MAIDIKKALKDKAYLDSLNKEELKAYLETSAGKQALEDAELDQVSGGLGTRDPSECTTTGSCSSTKRSNLLC